MIHQLRILTCVAAAIAILSVYIPVVYAIDSLPVNYRQSGKLSKENKADTLLTVLPEDGILEIETFSDDAKVIIDIIDEEDLKVTRHISLSPPDTGPGTQYKMYRLELGTYRIRVYSTTTISEDIPYDIWNTFTPAGFENDPEPNDDAVTAGRLELNNSDTGHLMYCTRGYVWPSGNTYDQDDWWIIETSEDGVLAINVNTVGSLEVNVSIFDDELIRVATGYHDDHTAEVSYYLSKDTYFIRVVNPGGNPYDGYFGSYTISNELIPPTFPNDLEPNNSSDEAVTVEPESSFTGHLGYCTRGRIDFTSPHQYDYSDYYIMEVPTEAVITVTADFDETLGLLLNLYDDEMIRVASGYPKDFSSKASYHISRGTYYLKASRYDNGQYGSYAIKSELVPAAYDNDPEPNNTCDIAGSLGLNASDTGHIGYCTRGRIDAFSSYQYDGKDWWYIKSDFDGLMTISLSTDETLFTNFSLYDDEQKSLKTVYASGSHQTSGACPVEAGTYYIETKRSYDEYGSYIITCDYETALLANDPESNDDMENAKTILFNGSDTGHLGYMRSGTSADTQDWWQFSIANKQDIEIISKADADTLRMTIGLYNSEGKELTHTYSEDRTATILRENAEPGYYYIKAARRSYTYGYGSYTLYLNHTPPAYDPPHNLRVNMDGDNYLLTWGLSPDDSIISLYNIFMSYQPVSSEPLDITVFETLEDLMSAEKVNTILIAEAVPGNNICPLTGNTFREDIRHYFWIQAVGDDGESMLVRAFDHITDVEEQLISGFYVSEPHPNPFNPSTVIDYTIPEDNRVVITAYSILGQQAAVITDTYIEAGRHTVFWDASELPSGVYIVTVRSGSCFEAKKTLLLK
ncbi:MAG: T9SS type A sorting domain-containing protein [Candidatus Latescibacteria bacterium]|nr:T9SS type A sorting domain-containing protein [Candidatus Latescibacterota bacterium]